MAFHFRAAVFRGKRSRGHANVEDAALKSNIYERGLKAAIVDSVAVSNKKDFNHH